MSHTGNVTGNYSGNFSGNRLANYSKNDLWAPFGTVDLRQYFDADDYFSVPSDTPTQLFDLSGGSNHTTGFSGTPVSVQIHPVIGRSLYFNATSNFTHAAGPLSEFGYSFSISLRTETGGIEIFPYTAQLSSQALRVFHCIRFGSSNTAFASYALNGTFNIGNTNINFPTGIISRYANTVTNNPNLIVGAINGVYVTPTNPANIYADGTRRCWIGGGLVGYIAACGFVRTDSLPSIYEMQRMEGYLFWRRNIQRFLDFNHPFCNRPPLIGD